MHGMIVEGNRNDSMILFTMLLDVKPDGRKNIDVHPIKCASVFRFAVAIIYLGPFYYHDLILVPAWISNHMLNKVCDEITNHSETSTLQVVSSHTL